MKPLRWHGKYLFILCALLLCGPPGAGGEQKVTGVGHAAASRPTVTDDPPEGYGTEHDPARGELFNGVGDYDLEQGADDDNKQQWLKNNYIHWRVHAATIEGEGKATDSDPAEATEVTSEAWGAQMIEVKIKAGEGSWGIIRADNRIGFEFSYSITGQHIGEGAVRLRGTAYDIKGKDHHFSLSTNVNESVTENTDRLVGLTLEDYRSLGIGVATSGAGSLGAGRQVGLSTGFQISASVQRRRGQGTSASGSTPGVMIDDKFEGPTPLSKKYEVFSDADAALVARAARRPAGGTSAVVVKVQKFKVLNSLRAFKTTLLNNVPATPGDPPPSDPPGGGPTTPPGDPPPTDPPGDGPTTPGAGPHGVPLPGPDYNFAWVEVGPPLGLDGEPGSRPGRLALAVTPAASRELVFGIEADDPGILDLAGADRLVVAAGRNWGSVPFHGREAGLTEVTLRLLDENGAATGTTLAALVETSSTAAYTLPRIWASAPGKPWQPGRDLTLQGIRGRAIGPLRVGRTGFAGLETQATVVHLEVEDPNDILHGLPASVTIPAGETTAEVPLALRDAAGDALLTLTAGDDRIEVAVRSVTQAWQSLDRIRVPVGAIAPVPFRLAYREKEGRAVSARAENPEVAVLTESGALLLPGEDAWQVGVRGLVPGVTTIELASAGLPTFSVPIEVVAGSVRLDAGRLVISDLDGSRDGAISIWVPAGMRIAMLAAPADSEEYLEITGVGTSTATLTFTAGADTPEVVSLAISFAGDGPPELGVLDLLHADETGPVNSFHLEIR